MNWHTAKKLKRAMRRTLTLLLSVAMLSGSVLAIHTGGWSPLGNIAQVIERSEQIQQEKKQKELKELYGDDWEKVAALQPGESYISDENMYVCHEVTYVDWKRIRTAEDMDPSDWGNEERLLLMTDTNGENLFVGNDYATHVPTLDGVDDYTELRAYSPEAVRQVISGVTTDTSGNNSVEYTEELIFPDMYRFYHSSGRNYAYPDTFRTEGTLNAPYIQYAGIDTENGNYRKFKIILAKDDGSMSGVGLSHDDDAENIQLKSVNECNGFTFYMPDKVLKIFEKIDDDEYLQLHFERWMGSSSLYGQNYESLEEMTTSNAQLYLGKKSVEKHIEVISLALEDAEQNPEALENVYGGAIEFYHWEKVTSSSQLPTDSDTYRALLVWDNKYFLQGDDFRKHSANDSGNDGMALYVNEEKKSGAAPGNVAEVPEIDLSQNEFYTMGGMGTPYMYFRGRDGNVSNDNCPMYAFQLAGVDDRPSEKWLCDGDNKLDLCLGETAMGRYGGMYAGIIVGQEADSGNDAAPGKVKLFYNETGWGRDTGFMYSGNVLYGKDVGWAHSEFTLYIGKPVVYPAVRQNYVVGEDQFMHISQNGAMLKNVTITVAKGGVLSIESWFMNNGRIVVDGGTLIVQNASNPLGDEEADDTEDSVMLPFADIHPTVSGSLELKNGGELIVLPGTRAAFSSITATSGSSVLNNGMLLAEKIDLHSSTLENREGMSLFVGYDFREMNIFRNGTLSNITKGLTSRLQSNVGCLTRRMYSSIHNDGKIIYSTVRMAVKHDSVKESGSGSYTKNPGSQSRNMLTQ